MQSWVEVPFILAAHGGLWKRQLEAVLECLGRKWCMACDAFCASVKCFSEALSEPFYCWIKQAGG